MKILIGAHYNLNNGDRALLEATVQIVRTRFPQCELTVSAYEPSLLNDTRFQTVPWPLKNGFYEKAMLKLSRYKICRDVYKRFSKLFSDSRYVKAVQSADVVLISGGHHLTDILGDGSYYRLASNFILPIAFEKKLILLPQSIGPVKDECVKASVEHILSNAKSIAYRDEASKQFLETLSIKCDNQYVPDLVFSLKPESVSPEEHVKEVGIALYHSYAVERRESILSFTIPNLTLVVDELIKRDYRVKILPMDEGDERIAHDIYEKLQADSKKAQFYVAKRSDNILELINGFHGLEFVLAYKTHSTIFSMICNTPLVAIAYHPKSIEFMESIGLPEFALNDTEASYDRLIEMIDNLEQNRAKIIDCERMGVEKHREMIRNYIQEKLEDAVD